MKIPEEYKSYLRIGTCSWKFDFNSVRVKRTLLIIFVTILMYSVCLSHEDKENSVDESRSEASRWFRNFGDYLVYLTLPKASPRAHMLFISSDWTSFETGVGKRLRLSSIGQDFHWGIEIGLFTSLNKYGFWNFKNISVDGKYGIFGLFHLKPLIFLLRLNHHCSNLLQGAPEFKKPIKYSQYSVYGQFFFPVTNLHSAGVRSVKPYFGLGAYYYQNPKSKHIPFDFGIEIESGKFLLSQKALHLGFHCSFTGMLRLVPTCSLFFGWGTSSEATISSLPFSIGVIYQWGQDARGQYYEQRRQLLGIRFNIMY